VGRLRALFWGGVPGPPRRDAPHAVRACPLCTALAAPAAAPLVATAAATPMPRARDVELDDILI
jgi:hypothetical protein